MNIIRVLGKYVDQPMVVAKCAKALPVALCGGAAICALKDISQNKENKKKETIKIFCTLTGTIASALIATRGLKPLKIGSKQIFKGFEGLSPKHDLKVIKADQAQVIENFLKNNKATKNIKNILEKAKSKILRPKDLKEIYKELGSSDEGKKLLENLIPEPKAVSSKEIFGEIKRLSLMGLVPILGGISGGILGDKLTEKNWKEKIPNKIKEGSYQYLANIFLCNVGAGAALGVMEKMHINSKGARAAGMIGGILAMGVIGGSAIANFIGKKCIDPFLGTKKDTKSTNLYDERKPEAIDIGLHVDDIATVSVMSGLKWIEPALPILYSISGYRAGIGYRNGEGKDSYHDNNKYYELFFDQKLNLAPKLSSETFKPFS